LNGAGYERWVTTTALPATRVVRTADGVPPLQTGRRTHSRGSDGAHSHGDVDPHTWMDPRAYETQAVAVHAALSRLPGADSTALDAALHALRDQLGQLDADLQAAAPVPAPPMASNHPSFGHLGRRLGLSIVSLDIDPAVPPDAGTMADIHDWAASGEMPVMLWEAQPSAAVMDALPATVVHLTLDPLEHPRPGRGYAHAEQAQTNVAALRSISRRRAPAESHRMGAGGGGR
ncbi:MAG: metal ABC transporter substrate-binding protein, partial [Myxococcota bacterium]|nr:metal ABC transporter substrate-binding protein [Myxococcota bacterium]